MSSETKFTQGPWRTQGWVPTWAYIPVKDARYNVVCSLYPNAGHYTREDVEANARLIAAAPDLYEALKIAYAHVSPAMQPTVYETMRAALSKARGEP